MKNEYTLSVNFKLELYIMFADYSESKFKNNDDNLKSHNLKIKDYLWKVRRMDWEGIMVEGRNSREEAISVQRRDGKGLL